MSSAYNNVFKILFNNRKCHSLNFKMDDVLRLLLSLRIFEVIFRTNDGCVRTAWLGMTDEVAPLVVCPHPTLAAGRLKSPCCNSSVQELTEEQPGTCSVGGAEEQ